MLESELTIALWAKLAEVDQQAAEYHDPHTSPERKAELKAEWQALFAALDDLRRQHP